jgi:hypothetical protein
MVRRSALRLALALLAAMTATNVLSQSPAPSPAPKFPDDDSYTPLRLYQGTWEAHTNGDPKAPPAVIANHCEKTGVFFVCEQVVNGKSEDLVVFLPQGSSGTTQTYKTEGLSVSGETPGAWGKLEISGDRWVYSNEATENGTTTYWKTINQFSGHDSIHFQIQRSADGKSWEDQSSGDERRVK